MIMCEMKIVELLLWKNESFEIHISQTYFINVSLGISTT